VHPTPLRDALTVLSGVATGVLSSSFGVGGATISTPAIRALGASATIAIGTTLPAILPSAATGTVQYVRERLISWRLVVFTSLTGLPSSVGGSLLSKIVPGHGHWLQVLTAALLGLTAWRMARAARLTSRRRPDGISTASPGSAVVTTSAEVAEPIVTAAGRTDEDSAPVTVSPWLLAGIGVAAGGLSGLLGIGGGIVMVPAFAELARVPVKTAIATSLACVGIFAVPGTITHSFLGDIDWRFAAGLAVGVVPGARIGAALAIGASDRRLRLAVAGFLGVIAVIYATGELLALR
jgi:uncharacterized membrane protein YfcA